MSNLLVKITDVIERINDGFVALDNNWCYTYMNKKAGELVNRDPLEMIGKNMWDEFPELKDDPIDFYEAYIKAVAEQQNLFLEKYYPPFNRWFETQLYTSPGVITIYFRDITVRKNTEEAIKKEKELSDSIINSLPGIFYLGDPTPRLLRWNKALETYSGYSAEELGKIVPITLFDPGDQAALRQAMEKAYKTGYGDAEVQLLSKSGKKTYFYFTGVTIAYEGKPVMLGTGIDITERKKSEQAIKESEEKYRLIVETAQEGIWMIDENSHTTFVNDRMAQLLGYTKEEITGIHLFDFMDDEGRRSAEENLERRKQGITEQHEFAFKTKEGKTIWTLMETSPIMKDGKYQGALAMVMDITERKKAEQAIKESEEKFRTLVESSPIGIFLFRPDGYVTYGNAADMRMTGLNEEETLGLNWIKAIHPDDLPQVMEEWKEAADSGKPYAGTGRYLHKDGTIVHWDVATAPIIIDGKTVGFIGTVTDITERKKAELAIKESEEKYRTLVEQASDGIFIADSSGRFITVNTSACKLSQYTEAELLKMSIYDFAAMEDIRKNPFHFDELKQGKTVNTERVMKGKDGISLHVGINAKFLSDGRLLTFVRDITEGKKAERALAENENYLRTILQTEPECVKVLNSKGELLSMNPAGLAMIEADDEQEILGHRMTELVDEKYRMGFNRLSKEVFKGNSGTFEFEVTGLKGGHRWLETHAVPLKNAEGKIINLLGVTRDITERKNAEAEIINTTIQLRQLTNHLQNIREEERKRIGREIHDELGQQLTAIKMDVAWIDKKTAGEASPIKNKLKNIITLLDGSNASVRKILSELRPAILDDHGLLEALEWQGRQFTESTGIPVEFITTKTALRLPEEIATCIFRVYQESLTNITRYAKAGKVLTSLNIIEENIVLTVEDNGKGFDVAAEQRKKTFGILGMKERVLSLNGKFELISAKGKGTKISISLPYKIQGHKNTKAQSNTKKKT